MIRISKRPLIALMLLVTVPTVCQAQFGCITGTVTDSLDSPLAYANVSVLGSRAGAMTDRNGNFVAYPVPVGRHSLKVMMMDHVPVEKNDVSVGLHDTTHVTFTLKYDPKPRTNVEHVHPIASSDVGKVPRPVRSDQLEQWGVYPDTLPRVRFNDLDFQVRFVLAAEGDSIAVKLVVEGTNIGQGPLDVCGVFSFLDRGYRLAPEIWIEHAKFGVKWDYPGPILKIGSRVHETPVLDCESVTLEPGSTVSDTLAFSYRADEFSEWPGEVRFWCFFFQGDDGVSWVDTRYVDLGVITIPIRASI